VRSSVFGIAVALEISAGVALCFVLAEENLQAASIQAADTRRCLIGRTQVGISQIRNLTRQIEEEL